MTDDDLGGAPARGALVGNAAKTALGRVLPLW